MKLTMAALTLIVAVLAAGEELVRLNLRSRVEAFRGSGQLNEAIVPLQLKPSEAAIVICDMWDNHWCRGAAERVNALAAKAVPVLDVARRRGVLIIHAPSDTMAFYTDAPQRQAILRIPRVEPPVALTLTDPPLPIDDSDGGCDTPGDKTYKAWKRQHATIPIAAEDLVSDSGAEIYSALRHKGINTLFVMGVHTNMCVLNRSFAIRQMTRWGVRCILIRDLTDAMYDPLDRPFVSHDLGTELVIEHIEKYWAPSVHSEQFVQALRQINAH